MNYIVRSFIECDTTSFWLHVLQVNQQADDVLQLSLTLPADTQLESERLPKRSVSTLLRAKSTVTKEMKLMSLFEVGNPNPNPNPELTIV